MRRRRVVRLLSAQIAADIAAIFLEERRVLVLRMTLEEEQKTRSSRTKASAPVSLDQLSSV
jgi:hypothetical protein